MKNSFRILDDVEGKHRWVLGFCEGGVCQDCFDRRDKIEPMEYWEKVGLPKSGFSSCKEKCNCYLREVKGMPFFGYI